MSTDVTFTKAGLGRGARLSLPFTASSVLFGVAFGLLATESGMSGAEAVAMSLLVFSGSAQIVVLQAWAAHPHLLAVFATVLIANLRYVLMGAALRSWMAPLGTLRTTVILLPLVDGSFALACRERDRGDHDAGLMFGSCLVSYAGWAVGTGIGATAGLLVANPKTIGLDFIIVAFCAASATLMARGLNDWWPVIGAAASVVVVERIAPGPWTVVAAGLAAAMIGAWRYQPAAQPAPDTQP